MERRNSEPVRAVLCGSFRRDRTGLAQAYDELVCTGCQVLSPRRLRFDDGEFVRDAAEAGLAVREIEVMHLTAIAQADFIWLHAPEGHVGTSASLEIGYALAHRIPIFARTTPSDVMLREFVMVVPSVYDARRVLGR